MLKIKDDIDLKELENYGFKKQYDIDTGNLRRYQHKDFEFVYVFVKDRELTATSVEYGEPRRINDLLYDLIKDGLVEKV